MQMVIHRDRAEILAAKRQVKVAQVSRVRQRAKGVRVGVLAVVVRVVVARVVRRVVPVLQVRGQDRSSQVKA